MVIGELVVVMIVLFFYIEYDMNLSLFLIMYIRFFMIILGEGVRY